ncbi:MAG: hypothetical protein KDA16_00855 [Phycisphaerales bacterium]|nr:hypothetical protein [Phycisphaerales bacterium]
MPSPKPRRKVRAPKLSFTQTRRIGWHVSYRDPHTGTPTRYAFGLRERSQEHEARILYHDWLAKHLGGETPAKESTPSQSHAATPRKQQRSDQRVEITPGSIIEISSGLISSEEARTRGHEDARRRGTIAPNVFVDRRKQIRDFLAFLNERHGKGAVARMRLADLSMADVEAYNAHTVAAGYSASQVAKRMQIVKTIIDRAGRPEYGMQILAWNWDSRDVSHGKPSRERTLPTVVQLERLLDATDLRGRTFIWMGIGLGFGARDLAAVQIGQIAEDAYDLRRGKTGIERFGDTPPLVWAHIAAYQTEESRRAGEMLFVTRKGRPLVHGRSDAVTQWWNKLRTRIGDSPDTLDGFYTLRHLGATEFGSRPGSSIGSVKRWLGHSASSTIADVYMRPVKPEYRDVVEWVRRALIGERC